MKVQIKHKYLVFPVNTHLSRKHLVLSSDTGETYELDIRLDNISPNFSAYIDVSRYMGQELSITVEPQMNISFTESDTMELSDVYNEPYRPQVHFSTKNGWINDPNGLIYADGKYHMFYQHNPCEPGWANMHWGHAISTDMIHWEETDIAMFPDKTGTMYSGSAIADKNNLLGLQTGELPTLLLYYTATNPFSQYVAYSTDGLKTIHKTDKPIIPFLIDKNRDPKIVFCDEWDAYALVLYMTGETYAIFRSNDMIHWDKIQEIDITGDDECPDLFPITADDGKRKWVLIGAHDRYLVGDMLDDGFHPTQEVQPLHYGRCAYAGQTFSGLPNGRIVRVDWDNWYIPTPRINGQMGFPNDITLKKVDGFYYLCALPIKEIETIYDEDFIFNDMEICGGAKKQIPLSPKPCLIKIEAELTSANNLTFNLFGRKIVCDTENNSVTLSTKTAPLSLNPNKLEIVILSDQCSLELYMDGGKYYMGTVDENTYCNYNLPYFEINATDDLKIKRMEIHTLKSIWSK